jgi:hypothetical protein
MNEETLQAITALAQKLGTTSEYLWSVLIQQAYLEAGLSLINLIVWGIITFFVVKIVYLKTKTPLETDEDHYPKAQWVEEGAVAAWLVSGVLILIAFIIISVEFNSLITALFNPEYWALKQIIK